MNLYYCLQVCNAFWLCAKKLCEKSPLRYSRFGVQITQIKYANYISIGSGCFVIHKKIKVSILSYFGKFSKSKTLLHGYKTGFESQFMYILWQPQPAFINNSCAKSVSYKYPL